jgi:hypothetical protein
MFAASKPFINTIAAERGITLPSIEGAFTSEAIAEKIVECLHHPIAEVFTQEGSLEFVCLAARNLEEAEQQQLPIVLGERAVYDQLKKKA